MLLSSAGLNFKQLSGMIALEEGIREIRTYCIGRGNRIQPKFIVLADAERDQESENSTTVQQERRRHFNSLLFHVTWMDTFYTQVLSRLASIPRCTRLVSVNFETLILFIV